MAKQYENLGYVSNSMILIVGFQMWYVFDAFTSEVRSESRSFLKYFFKCSPSLTVCLALHHGHHSRWLRIHACLRRPGLVFFHEFLRRIAVTRHFLIRVPFTYSLQARYLVDHPVDLDILMVIVILLAKYIGSFR